MRPPRILPQNEVMRAQVDVFNSFDDPCGKTFTGSGQREKSLQEGVASKLEEDCHSLPPSSQTIRKHYVVNVQTFLVSQGLSLIKEGDEGLLLWLFF